MTSPLPGTAEQTSPTPPPGPPVWTLIGPVLAAALGAFLLTITVGPELTGLQLDLQLPAAAAVWVFGAYLLPAALAVALGLRLGPRWPTALTLGAIALLVLGSLLITLAPAGGALLFGRAVSGFGAGLAWGVTAALVARVGAARVWLTPLAATLGVLAMLLGAVAGAAGARSLGWRWPFLLALPLGAVAFLVAVVIGIIVSTRRTGPAQPPAPRA